MAAKKSTTIDIELERGEKRLQDLWKYIEDNPIAELKDRIEWKPTSKGGVMPMVIASIEAQITSIRNTMKDYFALLETIKRLRESEEAKVEARGNSNLSGLNSL